MQHQPYPHAPPNYGAKIQYTPSEDTAPILNKQQTKFIQEVMGTFLYYMRAVNRTMLITLSALATDQAKHTMTMMKNTK